MNAKTKKGFYQIIILTVFVVLLSSCSQSKPTVSPVATSSASETNNSEPITLTVWAHNEPMIQFAKTKFEASHPNIKIDLLIIPSPDDYFTKLDTAVAAGQVPDIAEIPTRNQIQAGIVLDLDPYFAKEGWSLDSFPPSINSAPENGAVLNGKLYVVPTNMYVWGMIINKDLFKEAGLPELTPTSVITYDDWLTYARAINRPSEDPSKRVWGSVYFYPGWNSMNNYMSEPYIYGPDGKTCTGNSSDWQHFFEIQKTAFDEQLTVDSSASAGDADAFDLFLQGKIGMMYGSQSELIYAKNKGLNVSLVGQPVVTKDWSHNTGYFILGFSIMKNASHPAESWEFLKYILTDASLDASLSADESFLGIRGALPPLKTVAEEWKTKLTPEEAEALSTLPFLLENAAVAPFVPDMWGPLSPYDDAFTAITQQGENIKTALDTATTQCQQLNDDAWATWDSNQ